MQAGFAANRGAFVGRTPVDDQRFAVKGNDGAGVDGARNRPFGDLDFEPALVAFEQLERLGDAAARGEADLDDAGDAVGAQADGAGGGMAGRDDWQDAPRDGEGRREFGLAEKTQSSPSMMWFSRSPTSSSETVLPRTEMPALWTESGSPEISGCQSARPCPR